MEPNPDFTLRILKHLSRKWKPNVASTMENNAIIYLKLAFKATIFSIYFFKLNWGWLAHLVIVALIKNFTHP